MRALKFALAVVLLFTFSVPNGGSEPTGNPLCQGLSFDGAEWAGVEIEGTGTPEDPYLVRGLDFDLRSGEGLSINGSSHHILVTECRFFYGNDHVAIDIADSSNVTIDLALSFRCWMGLRVLGCEEVSVRNMTIYGGVNGTSVTCSAGISFDRCLLTYNNANGMVLKDSNGIAIRDCSMDVNSPKLGSDQGLLVENCSGLGIVNSTFRMNYGNGMTVLGSDVSLAFSIVDNNVNGIWAEDSVVTVTDCSFLRNTHGLFLLNGSGSYAGSCDLRENFNGITIFDSTYVGVQNCSFSRNEDCVTIKGSNLNWVIGNTFRNNTGFSVAIGGPGENDTSSTNLVTSNLFSDHKGPRDQVLDMGKDNHWCDCVGGNYWSDIQGPDSDHDGIVDRPRSIPGIASSSDLYPMIIEKSYPVPQEGTETTEDDILYVYMAAAISVGTLLVLAFVASNRTKAK